MKKLFFPLLLFVSGLLSAQTEITLYVSPSGSDHPPGTAEKPMATLEYAWKKASRQAGRRSITIYCEGTNYLSAQILITNETSGTPEHPIRFSSYPGQKAAALPPPCGIRGEETAEISLPPDALHRGHPRWCPPAYASIKSH